jgi:nucleotide-binding universal stress UspA family protein
MYKKILVPLDGSEYSECALDHAKELALSCHISSVVILYVIEPINPGMYEVPAQVIDDAAQKGKDFGVTYLTQVAAKMKAQGLEVETVLMSGRVTESILDYVKANGVDLIAMSTHGRSGISRMVLGSVADKIVRRSSIPVLLVTPPESKAADAKK